MKRTCNSSKRFLLASGSLKALAKDNGISNPRSHPLDRLIAKVAGCEDTALSAPFYRNIPCWSPMASWRPRCPRPARRP
jgi:hypothetical protein